MLIERLHGNKKKTVNDEHLRIMTIEPINNDKKIEVLNKTIHIEDNSMKPSK